MNFAHVHLVINHLPVVGTLFCFLLVLAASFMKNQDVLKLSLGFCIFIAVVTIPVFLTGDPAKDVIEKMPGISDNLIESHEEAAVFSFILVEIMGVLSAVGIYTRVKKIMLPKWYLTSFLFVIFLTMIFMTWTANQGGKIQHKEIQVDFK